MNKSSTTQAIFPALALAQGEMPAVKMNSQNPFLKNKYADLGAVIETSRPILAKHGLAIIQTPVSDGDKIGVTTMLIHSSGEWVEETIFINTSESKGLSSAQTVGVTISYLRRYSWASFLGLYADEDTDGNKSDAKPMQKTEQPKQEHRPAVVKEAVKITDQEWEAFGQFAQQALSMGIKLPEYNREKLSPAQLAGATKYIQQEIAKAGK